MNEQIELDRETAINALRRYLNHFLIPERNEVTEELICELDKRGIIQMEWVEID